MRSFRTFQSVATVVIAVVLCITLAACNQSGPKLQPVRGKVLFNEQPAEGAQVIFQPVAGGESQPLTPTGSTAADGSFTLQAHPHGEGAPAGEYVVLINSYGANAREEANPKNKLPAKYSKPEAGLIKVTVKEGNNELPPFKLTP